MKVLTLDLETSPLLVYTWGLRNQFISIGQIVEPTRVLCFGAKWLHERRVQHFSEWADGKQGMLDAAHRLISEADMIVGYNHRSFDMKHLTREFMEAHMPPPSPVQTVDLYREATQAYFPSHKLQYVSTALGLEGKLGHTGFKLWIDVMAGDEKAQRLMERYCKQDVALTEKLYTEMLPYLKSLPNAALYLDDESNAPICPRCASTELTRQGFNYTRLGKFQQFRCGGCGSWSRGKKNLRIPEIRGAA
ncbi:MAG: hypothetical protein JWN22_1253 [Nocardioides sp.]|nr:hypothetical protein [Nocardioides sp.]